MADRMVSLGNVMLEHDGKGLAVLSTVEQNGKHKLVVEAAMAAVPFTGLTDTQLRASPVSITKQDSAASGTITATNGNVAVACTGKGTVSIQVEGTYTGALTPQARVNPTGAWVTLTGATTLIKETGGYSATIASAQTGIWQVDVTGYAEFRLIGLAAVTGTATVSLRSTDAVALTALDTPLPAGTSVIGGVTQSGTWTVTANMGTPSASNINSAASTNATAVKTSAGTVYAITASNTNAAARYLKYYNKASAPTVGTDVPILTVVLPPGATTSVNLGNLGHRFATGIALAITSGAADSDTGAVAAGEVKVLTSFV